MADSSPLAGLLDRAGNVFSLAGKLGRAFHEEHQGQHAQIDAASWKRHAGVFDEFCTKILDLQSSMQNPPDGFASVAEQLLEAAHIAKGIRDTMQRPDGQTWATCLGFFPELNSVCEDGWLAINGVMAARRLDDPFAFVDEPNNQPTTLAEMLRRIVRRLQAKPDLLRGYQWDHPEILNVTEVNARAGVLGLGPIFMIGDAPDWVCAPNLPADHPANTKRIECLIVRHPDGTEFRIRRTGGQLDDSSTLPTTETIARLEAWIERAANVTRAIELEREMVVVETAGDLWKSYAEGKRACFKSSAISLRPGANTPEMTCPDSTEDTKRMALERAQALAVAEGGDKAAAMEKLIARVQLKTGMSKASVINMPLADFVAMLMGEPTPNNEGQPKELIERLLAGPDDAELTARELAWLEAYLKQPGNRHSLADLQAHANGQPLSERAKQLGKLRLIKDFNKDLAKRDAERDDKMAALVESLGVREMPAKESTGADADADTKHRRDDTHGKPKPKRSTERGEGRAKLIAALTKHHKYADGGCLNLEPIGNNELARLAGVDQATASAFFKQQFKGHGKYKATCADAGRLAVALKLLNGEFAPHLLYGGKPADKHERDEE